MDQPQPRAEWAGRILTDRRQLSQGGSGRRGHTAKLPADLLADSLRPVRGGQSSRLGGIRRGTQGVRTHMRDGCRLPGPRMFYCQRDGGFARRKERDSLALESGFQRPLFAPSRNAAQEDICIVSWHRTQRLRPILIQSLST